MNNLKLNKELLKVIIESLDDKLATDTLALDVSNLTPLADYFVVTSGKNDRQVDAIVSGVEEAVTKAGYDIKNVEGKDGDKWILIDCIDVIVHVFYYSERSFYNIEKLWADAPLVNIEALNQ